MASTRNTILAIIRRLLLRGRGLFFECLFFIASPTVDLKNCYFRNSIKIKFSQMLRGKVLSLQARYRFHISLRPGRARCDIFNLFESFTRVELSTRFPSPANKKHPRWGVFCSWLREKDSNLRPIAYILSSIARRMDYIIPMPREWGRGEGLRAHSIM